MDMGEALDTVTRSLDGENMHIMSGLTFGFT
jgi:hypothetical protein